MDTSTPQIYTLDEWRQNNQRRFNESDNSRSEWFRVKEQSKQLMQEKQILTASIQDTATEKLSERAKDIREWKNKLERCLEAITAEIKRLELLKARLWSSLDKADRCAIVARECLDVRKLRISTDLVEDNVQRELLKEAEMVEMYRNLTHKYINETEEQLRKDYAAKNQLEKDWSDKWEAYSIDASCSMMKNTSSDQIASYPGPEEIPSKWSTPKEWVDFTRENIKLCHVEVEASKELAYLVEQHVKKGAEDIQRQSDIVLAEFHRRNIETNDCLYRLREHLRLVGESIAQAEKTVNNLRIAILEKEPSLKKVQTRLHLRYGRPNVELCHDPAQEFLVQESRILSATIQQLQEQLVRAEAVLRNLQETRRDIEREIAIKENSVSVDQVRCSRIRQKYPQKHDLYGY